MSDEQTRALLSEITRKADMLVGLLAQSPPGAEGGGSSDAGGAMLSAIGALSQLLDEAPLCEQIVRGGLELTGADRGFVMLLEGRGKLRFKAGIGVSQEDLMGGDFDGSRSVIKEVVTGGEAVLRGSGANQGSVTDSMSRTKVQTVICVPLPVGRRKQRCAGSVKVAGILYVDSRSVKTLLDQPELDRLTTYAGHCTWALENAWLYSDARGF